MHKQVRALKPVLELSKFSDGRFMLKVHFYRNSNYWIHDPEHATWVPTLEESDLLKEALDLINERNEIKRITRLDKPRDV